MTDINESVLPGALFLFQILLVLEDLIIYLANVETSPHIDEEYLSFIRSKPCIIDDENCLGDIIPHHIRGRGMRGERRQDHLTVPFCSIGHHVGGQFSIHIIGIKTFEKKHFVNQYEYAAIFLSEYLQLKNGNDEDF